MIRRTFAEFVEFNDIDFFNEEFILESSFISRVANWLGDKGKNFNSVVTDLKHFPKKVKLAYGGMNANLISKDEKLPKDKRKEIINNLNDKKVGSEQIEYLKTVWKENSDNEDFKKSGFMVYALLYGKELAQNENDKESVTFFDRGIKSIDNETLKNAKEARNNEKSAEDQEDNNPSVIDKGEEINKEEVKDDIESKVNNDPLLELSKISKLDSKKLKESITYLVYKDNKDKSTEDFDKMITGLGAIICGAKILGDDEKLNNDILKGWGIESIKVLVDEIMKEI